MLLKVGLEKLKSSLKKNSYMKDITSINKSIISERKTTGSLAKEVLSETSVHTGLHYLAHTLLHS